MSRRRQRREIRHAGRCLGLGFIVGRPGGILGGIDATPFWVAAGLSLANALYGYFIRPVAAAGRATLQPARQCGAFGTPVALRRNCWAAAVFLVGMARSAAQLFVLYADQRCGWSETNILCAGRTGFADRLCWWSSLLSGYSASMAPSQPGLRHRDS
jgi:hypothetical protein